MSHLDLADLTICVIKHCCLAAVAGSKSFAAERRVMSKGRFFVQCTYNVPFIEANALCLDSLATLKRLSSHCNLPKLLFFGRI